MWQPLHAGRHDGQLSHTLLPLRLLILALPSHVHRMGPLVGLYINKAPVSIPNGVKLRAASAAVSRTFLGQGILLER